MNSILMREVSTGQTGCPHRLGHTEDGRPIYKWIDDWEPIDEETGKPVLIEMIDPEAGHFVLAEIAPEFVRLATLCDESGLTRMDIAERAGMSPGNLTRLLNGSRPGASLLLVGRVLRAIRCGWAELD